MTSLPYPLKDIGVVIGKVILVLAVGKPFLLQEPEVVVQDEISIWLFGQEEHLDKLLEWSILFAHFTNDMHQDTIIGTRLRVNRYNKDFAAHEVDGHDFLVNFSLTVRNVGLFTLYTIQVIRFLRVEPVKFVRFCVHMHVILGDK
jgi:hypothetical protein